METLLQEVTVQKFSLQPELPPPNFLNSPKVGGGKYKLYNFKSDAGPTEQAYVISDSRERGH